MEKPSNKSSKKGNKPEQSSEKYDKADAESLHKLKRGIGLLEAVGITVGSIIGSGIFISPKGITIHVKSVGASLVTWVFCGLLSTIGAFCFAELGTTFPSAGGQYTYILEAFGPLLAFLYLWANNLIFVPIGNSVTGQVFAKYIVQPFFPTGCVLPDIAVRLLAAVAIGILSLFNCCDIRYINQFINVFMVLKLTAVGLIVLGGAYAVLEHGTTNFDNMWEGSSLEPDSLLLATFAGVFAFGGWQAMSTMMEELKEPNKNLPRAIFISLAGVTLIYLLANVAYFAVLTPMEMVSSDAVAVTFVNRLFGSMGWIVPIFVSLSTFGFLSIHIMCNSRNCFVGARNGHFPTVLSLITTSYRTPATSIIFQSLLSLVYLYTADVFALINFAALPGWIFNTISIAALLYLRKICPELERPFKVSILVPITYFLISMVFVILPFYVNFTESVISIALILTGLPVYYLLIHKNQQSNLLKKLSECCTVTVQKLLMSVKEE